MNSLRGVFPEPKIKYKRNFIKENIKYIKRMQGIFNNVEIHLTRKSDVNIKEIIAAEGVSKTKEHNDKKSRDKIHKIQSEPQTNISKKHVTKSVEMSGSAKSGTTSVPKQSNATNNIEQESSNFRSIGLQTDFLNIRNTKEKSKRTISKISTRMCAGDTTTNRNNEKINEIDHKSKKDAEKENTNSKPDFVLKKSNEKNNLDMKGYQRGVVPKYIRDRQKELEPIQITDPECPPGHVPVPDAERKETLRALRQSYADLISELNKLPVKSDTLRTRNRKIELEKQLNKIEEGIKVFSRPKVYVKINA